MAQRADAERNRQRVLDAAATLHAQYGDSLAMQDVARDAGVGVGTVYRHFPTRDSLIDAIARPFYERSVEIARATREDTPAGAQTRTFVLRWADALVQFGVPGHCAFDAPAAGEARTELRAIVADYVVTDQRFGTLRSDLTREDILVLLSTVTKLVEACQPDDDAVWRRYVALTFDGLRAGGPPTPDPAPPIEPAMWDRTACSPDRADPRRSN